MSGTVTLTDRLQARERPEGMPVMRQSWGKLLFIHWEIEPSRLRPHIPRPIEIDTFDGKAYIAITPFTLWNVRPIFLPPIPFFSAFHETNVRTYVHLDGVPGVWFHSLDANGLLAVVGARLAYHLPYYYASISLEENAGRIDYGLKRSGETPARFAARWSVDELADLSTPGSLEFFLTERYCLFTSRGENIYRARIHHEPWPLHSAELISLETNLFEADGLAKPDTEPFVIGGGPVHVDVWRPERVAAAVGSRAADQGFSTTLTQPSS